MTPRIWPMKLWIVVRGSFEHVAFFVDQNGKPTTPALFPTRKAAALTARTHPDAKVMRVNVTLEAVSK